jgi:transposase
MFVRVKTTPNSPRKSVQIVKSVRRGDNVVQKIVRYVGIAMDDDELVQLKQLAETIKDKLEAEENDQIMLFSHEEGNKNILTKRTYKDKDYQVDVRNLKEEQRVIKGIHDVYGNLFEELNFKSIFKNPARSKSSLEIFKNIVLARIAHPTSKNESVEMLAEHFGIYLDLHKVYKMMDKIDDEVISKLNKLSFKETSKLFNNKLDVVFYDCTTIYFECFEEDDLRKNGYSKDLKFNQPQVLLSMLVSKEGLPINYNIYTGNTYEGHTLIPALDELRKSYEIDKVVIVADSGMFNDNNLIELENKGYEYIVCSRLKNLPKKLQEQVTVRSNYESINITNDIDSKYKAKEFNHNGRKLIVSWSSKRSTKDKHDRDKAIEKLKVKLKKSKNQKDYLSNYGYKKYLKIEGNSKIILNDTKIEEASKWDGLHGVITNSKDLSITDVLEQYRNLWEVENAFRISKHDLKIRPVYHWKPSRVKAHFAICYVSYCLTRYLEYRVKLQYKKLSPEKIRKALVSSQLSIYYNKSNKLRYGLASSVSQDAVKIYQTLGIKHSKTAFIIDNL